jgi:ankyrin repeat protein
MLRVLVLMMFLVFSTVLLAQESDENALVGKFFRAIMYNDVEEVKNLLEKGVDINSFDERGQTALIRAGVYQNLEVFQLLLDSGANLWLTDGIGENILKIAERNELYEVVKVITEHIIETEFYNGRKTHFLEDMELKKAKSEPILEQEEIGADRMEYSRSLLRVQ